MVNLRHSDLIFMEKLIQRARIRFAMLPVGADPARIALVFWRLMWLRRHISRLSVRTVAMELLLRLRWVTEFRTRQHLPWCKLCVHVRWDG
jgi:hypothetical protein